MKNVIDFANYIYKKHKNIEEIYQNTPNNLKNNIIFLEYMFNSLRRNQSQKKTDIFVNKFIIGKNNRSLLPIKRDILFYYKDCITDNTYQNLFIEFPIVELKIELLLAKCIKNENIKSFKIIMKQLKNILKDRDVSYGLYCAFLGNLLLIKSKSDKFNKDKKILNLELIKYLQEYFPIDNIIINNDFIERMFNGSLPSRTTDLLFGNKETLLKKAEKHLLNNWNVRTDEIKSDFFYDYSHISGQNDLLETIEDENLIYKFATYNYETPIPKNKFELKKGFTTIKENLKISNFVLIFFKILKNKDKKFNLKNLKLSFKTFFIFITNNENGYLIFYQENLFNQPLILINSNNQKDTKNIINFCNLVNIPILFNKSVVNLIEANINDNEIFNYIPEAVYKEIAAFIDQAYKDENTFYEIGFLRTKKYMTMEEWRNG